MGLHHRKGRIAVGLDADLAVVGLDAQFSYGRENVRSSAGFSIYEGHTFTGKVLHTIVRGRLVLRDGETVDSAIGSGRFVKRSLG
jgi:dihydropyrimidinase/allantoinase